MKIIVRLRHCGIKIFSECLRNYLVR